MRNVRGRPEVEYLNTSNIDLGKKLLAALDVSEYVKLIEDGIDNGIGREIDGRPSFTQEIEILVEARVNNKKISPSLGGQCKGCEFRVSKDKMANNQISGFLECWSSKLKNGDSNLVFDVWKLTKDQADYFIRKGKHYAHQIEKWELDRKSSDSDEPVRQWLQIETVKSGQKNHVVEPSLFEEMSKHKFPLNFIDFETCMLAVPMVKGMAPYETIAFQFSHHVLNEDGTVEHRSQWINSDAGKFPNFEFVRNLKQTLSSNAGTIFRYATHENTVLCHIKRQLEHSEEPDRAELIDWIKSITTSPKEQDEKWEGERSMVDMLEMVRKYYYHPLMKGSNSIKVVLPAVLNSSSLLQKTYSQPIYGAQQGVPSLNFTNMCWIARDAAGMVKDPYKLLDPIHPEIGDQDDLDLLLTENELRDGGAAMTAYCKMQFIQMSDVERTRLKNALLRYCELDTFAMVLIYQHWLEIKASK